MTSELKQQFTFRISQANSTDLVVILYEMALAYIDESIDYFESSNIDEFKSSMGRARGCINELLGSLNYKYPPATELSKLYFYCIRRLANASLKEDVSPLLEVKKVLTPLKDAYAQIAPQNKGGAIMGNSQTVFAGLTYGRNTLTENMADQGANRGMRV